MFLLVWGCLFLVWFTRRRTLRLSPSRQYFTPNKNGEIYNLEGTLVNAIYPGGDDSEKYASFAFNKDESSIYALNDKQTFSYGFQTLEKYSFPVYNVTS